MMKIGGHSSGAASGPIIRMVNPSTHHQGNGGFECCFVRCCTCIHLAFLRTCPGIVKVLETILGCLIQSVLINYGLRYSATIGSAFEGALTTSSGCLFTNSLLLFCYVISEKSYWHIRSSLFEILFNAVSCFLYLSSAACLAFATKMFLWPMYVIRPSFDVYHWMTAVYLMSGAAGLLHGADAYFSFSQFVTQR